MNGLINLKVDNLAYGNIVCGSEWKVVEKGLAFHRIYIVRDGVAVYKDSAEQFHLKKGFIYIFPVNKPYLITHDPTHPLNCLWFHIITAPLVINLPATLQIKETTALFHLLKVIEVIVGNCTAEYKRADMLLSQLIESLVLLLNQEIGFSTIGDERLISIIEYIHENYNRKLTTEFLSGLAGFDLAYFIRLFKKTFGATPQSYISKYRLNRAVSMLLKKISVATISENIGFQNVKAFSRAFKRINGVPPSKYIESQSWQH